jgi:hypothetical protein
MWRSTKGRPGVADRYVVGGRCHPGDVDVSAEAVAKVPGENLRVSRADFGGLWTVAEQLGRLPAGGADDDYVVGVIWTCRWLARQPVCRGSSGGGRCRTRR